MREFGRVVVSGCRGSRGCLFALNVRSHMSNDYFLCGLLLRRVVCDVKMKNAFDFCLFCEVVLG